MRYSDFKIVELANDPAVDAEMDDESNREDLEALAQDVTGQGQVAPVDPTDAQEPEQPDTANNPASSSPQLQNIFRALFAGLFGMVLGKIAGQNPQFAGIIRTILSGNSTGFDRNRVLAMAPANVRPQLGRALDNIDPNTGNLRDEVVLGDLADIENLPQAKEVVEQFLGSRISDDDMNMLIRATAAEASPNAQERAAVAAVILNRIRSDRFPNDMHSVLHQPNQFQAVTGTSYDPGPSRNYTGMTDQTGAEVIGAIIRFLPDMNRTWLNFTSNNPNAYGAGTNIDFMYTMRDAPGSQIIGQTVFGTA